MKYKYSPLNYKSDIKIFNIEDNLQSLKNYKDIIIFGTGNYGALALHALKKHNINISCFCDYNDTNCGNDFLGYKVISVNELKKSTSYTAVVIASLRFNYMSEQIKSNDNLMKFDCDFLFFELDLSKVKAFAPIDRLVWMLDSYMFAIDASKKPDVIKVKSLDVVLTEKCSLRCENCSNLMQYYEKPKDNDTKVLETSIERFMHNIDELYEARVIGGEPFLYKDISTVIKQLSNYKKCKKITIFTNGTIIPNSDTIESMKNSKVTLIISDYGKISKKITELKNLLIKMKIHFIAYDVDKWQDCAKIEFVNRTENELCSVFGNCCVNDALTLLHGKVYTCPFSANVTNLKAIPPEYYEDEFDLMKLDDDSIKRKIAKLNSGQKYLKACSFCPGRDYSVGLIEAAIQVKKPLPYKKYLNIDSSNLC